MRLRHYLEQGMWRLQTAMRASRLPAVTSCSSVRRASARPTSPSAWRSPPRRAVGASAAGNLSRRLRVLTHPTLMVVDEIGYLPVTREGRCCSSS